MTLASLPAHLVVIALLAALALRMLAVAERKGRGALPWTLALFGAWLGVLGLAALGARFAYEQHYHALPGFWAVYGPAVACAFLAALSVFGVLLKKPALTAPVAAPDIPTELPPAPSSLPQPTPLPEPPPPAAITTFKFACLHCGQRLAVTTADIGTTANCPNCEALLEVPGPPAES